jgi:hypothetical protein
MAGAAERPRPRRGTVAGIERLRSLPALARSGRTEARAELARVQERAQKEMATAQGRDHGLARETRPSAPAGIETLATTSATPPVHPDR